jgi:ABC-type bacteriocin/lantibiotic exporter with double-glycine peptidase domain
MGRYSMFHKTYPSHRTSSLHFVFTVLYPFRGYLVALILILVAYSGNVFLKTQLIKDIVDATAQVSNTPDALWLFAGYLGGVLFIELVTFRLQEWCTLKYESALQNHITAIVFEHVLQREYRFFQAQLSGNLVAKVHDVATCIPAWVVIVLYDYFLNFLLVCVAFFSLCKVSHGLAWAIFLWALLTVAAASRITPRSLQLANDAAETAADIKGRIVDAFDNILTVRFFSAKNYVLRQLNRA